MESTNKLTIESFREFEKDPYIVGLRRLIETGDIIKNLHDWSKNIVELVREYPKDEFIICLFGWFVYNFFLPFDAKIELHRKINNMDMDESKDDIEIRNCFETQETFLRLIIKKGIQPFEELKESIEDDISMFGRNSLRTELRHISKFEKERELLNFGRLKSLLNKECLIEIHTYLINHGLKSGVELWLYWFGYVEQKNQTPMKFVFSNKNTSQMLSNVLNHICGGTTNKAFMKAFGLTEKLPNKSKEYYGSQVFLAIENIIKKYTK